MLQFLILQFISFLILDEFATYDTFGINLRSLDVYSYCKMIKDQLQQTRIAMITSHKGLLILLKTKSLIKPTNNEQISSIKYFSKHQRPIDRNSSSHNDIFCNY